MPDRSTDPGAAVSIERGMLTTRWPLPEGANSKRQRGNVLIIGGAAKTPGAVILAGTAALRVGAGRITLCVAESVAAATAAVMPEGGVIGIPESKSGSIAGKGLDRLEGELQGADVVLIGPGLDEPVGTARLLRALAPVLRTVPAVHLDAFPLGVLRSERRVRRALAGRLLLTPNATEAELLLGTPITDLRGSVRALAHRYDAVISCFNLVATPEGELFEGGGSHEGLATAGSGDVLAGATAGISARGLSLAAAACWGVFVHTHADDRLSERIGPSGYLARELPAEFPAVLCSREHK